MRRASLNSYERCDDIISEIVFMCFYSGFMVREEINSISSITSK